MNKKILLEAGSNTYLVRHLPRIFARAGAELTLLAAKAQPYRHSRYVDHWIESSEDASDRADLLRHEFEKDQSSLIVITTERVFEILSSDHSHIFPWLSRAASKAFQTKSGFSQWAKESSISMPDSQICNSPEEAQQWFSDRGEAMMKVNHLGSGEGVAYVNSSSEIPKVWQQLKSPSTFLMQSYIQGQVGVTELILHQGKVLAWFSSLKSTTKSPFGPSISRQIIFPKQMRELVEQVARASGFHGFCGFDWILNEESGEVKIIEFHPRCPSGFGWGQYAGVDVEGAVFNLLNNGSGHCAEPDETITSFPLLCYFPDHLQYALKHKRSDLVHWLPWTSSVAWKNVPFYDPKVLAAMTLKILRGEKLKNITQKTQRTDNVSSK